MHLQAEIETEERFWIFLLNLFNLARNVSLTKGEALQQGGWWDVVRSMSNKWRKYVDCFACQLIHSWVDFLLCVTELLYHQHCYHIDEQEHKRREANWSRSIILCCLWRYSVLFTGSQGRLRMWWTEHQIHLWRGIVRPPLSHIFFLPASLATLPHCLAAVQPSFIFNPNGTMRLDLDRKRKRWSGGERGRYIGWGVVGEWKTQQKWWAEG